MSICVYMRIYVYVYTPSVCVYTRSTCMYTCGLTNKVTTLSYKNVYSIKTFLRYW